MYCVSTSTWFLIDCNSFVGIATQYVVKMFWSSNSVMVSSWVEEVGKNREVMEALTELADCDGALRYARLCKNVQVRCKMSHVYVEVEADARRPRLT